LPLSPEEMAEVKDLCFLGIFTLLAGLLLIYLKFAHPEILPF
jgi:hypothetical protein